MTDAYHGGSAAAAASIQEAKREAMEKLRFSGEASGFSREMSLVSGE